MEVGCLGSDARSYLETFIRSPNSFRIKSRTGEVMGQFCAGPTNKAVRVLETAWQKYATGDGRYS